jgi:hypothetical protein
VGDLITWKDYALFFFIFTHVLSQECTGSYEAEEQICVHGELQDL